MNTNTAATGLSTEAMRAALAAARYGAWTADASGGLTFVDNSFLRLLGRTADEVLGVGWLRFLAPEVQHVAELSWWAAIRAGEPFERLHSFLTVEAERRTVLLRANPIRDERGEVQGWAGLHLDALNEERALKSESPVERFLESTTDAFVALDREFRFTYCNRVACEFVQKKAEELIGRNHWDAFPMLVGTRVEQEYRRALAEQTAIHFEFQVPSVELWLDIHVYPTREGLAVYFRDVSPQRLAEERLNTALEGARAGVWEWDINTDSVSWSPQTYELLRIDPSTTPSRELFMSRIDPADQARMYSAVVHAIDNDAELREEIRLAAPSPSEWLLVQAKVMRDLSGKALRLVGLAQAVTERKEIEARFERLANGVPCIVWMLDHKGFTRWVNRRWYEVTGIEGQPTPEDWQQVIHPDDLEPVQRIWWDRLRSGTPYEAEVRYRTVAGDYRWYLERGEAIRGEDGEIVEWFGTSVDIHDRKLEQSRTQLLLDSMPLIAWSSRADGTVDYLNRHYIEFSTGGQGELRGEQGWTMVVHPDDREAAHQEYARCYASGQVWEQELRLLRHDGEYRWHLSRLVPLKDDDGVVYRWFGTSTDIEDQKVKEQSLAFLVQVYEKTHTLEDPLAIVDTTAQLLGRHLGVNRVVYAEIEEEEDFFEVLGDYTHETFSIVGRRPLAAFGNHSVKILRCGEPLVVNNVAQELEGTEREGYLGLEIASFLCVPLHKGDRLVGGLAVQSKTPRVWSDEERRLVGMVADSCRADLERARAARGLRELNQELEERVQERTAELVEANREMEGFTYTVSHDLRAPLRAIMATSMILLEEAGEKLAKEERSLLERQAHNAKYLGVLIDELLKLSRISRQEMVMTRFDLSSLANDVVEELSQTREVSVKFEIEPELSAVGDEKLLRFVLLNLIENACKFSPSGGTVYVGRYDGAFFVRDEGIGFDPRFGDKLFRPFERLVAQSEYPGTGIGLANVKRIVERHGGEVWAESTPGQGATFWFTLGN